MRQHDISRTWSARLASLTVAGLLFTAGAVEAQWLNKSTMTFSKPVMVPGATLAPGTYVFELHDLLPTLHTIQIKTEDESRIIATAQAVPVKRMDLDGTTTLEFTSPTAEAPPAMKAWFYPGTRYGHEFLYPEAQARKIAETSKMKVLSEDPPAGDADGGVFVFDQTGNRMRYTSDAEVTREWGEWSKKHRELHGDETATDDDPEPER